MYTDLVRCGNLIASQEQMNPMIFWWGMKEVSRVGNHGEGNLEDSWRTNTLPMPTGHAPPKHHGVFSFGLTVLHTIAVHLHGWLGRKHRTHYTHGIKATSVGLATGKAQVHGGTRLVYKANKLVIRTWGFFVFKAHKAWSGRLEGTSIHPW